MRAGSGTVTEAANVNDVKRFCSWTREFNRSNTFWDSVRCAFCALSPSAIDAAERELELAEARVKRWESEFACEARCFSSSRRLR